MTHETLIELYKFLALLLVVVKVAIALLILIIGGGFLFFMVIGFIKFLIKIHKDDTDKPLQQAIEKREQKPEELSVVGRVN